MTRFSKTVLCFLLILPFGVSCIHTINAPYKVSERRKEALLFRKDGLSHLIVRTEIAGAKGAKGLAWVIPLPEHPVVQKEESGQIFAEMYRMLPDRTHQEPLAVRMLPSCSVASAPPAIKVHDPVTTKSFVLQAVEIQREEAAEELNRWLVANGFSPVPAENQKFYLTPGRVFMCVRLGKVPDAESFEMPALHFAWRKAPAQLPLKFSSHSGVFDVDLYVLSNRRLPTKASRDWRMQSAGSCNVSLETIGKVAPWLVGAGTYLSRYKGVGYNSEGNSVKELTTDPSIISDALE